jgi:mannose-6-phosphate isomerase-like protein (cupin superfamily)
MKIIHNNQIKIFNNSKHCVAKEYPLGDRDINGAVIELKGRYPDKGAVMNLKCKELAYVVKGSGRLVIEGKETLLHEGDLALIEPGEKYYWDGNMTMFMPCTPAWYPEQHKEVA